MDTPLNPLSEAELDLLDNILMSRIDEDIDTFDMDEGILNISELDGFFTAIASGPIAIQPSVWLPMIWGDFEPDWESEELFMEMISLMMRHMNGIVDSLMEQADTFEPLFFERYVDEKTYTIVDEWCEGYRRGVDLAVEHWDKGGEEVARRLSFIYAFTEATDWQGHNYSEQEVKAIQEAIPANVREIHAYWLSRRHENTPLKQSESHPGPDDPCPCGSGKKFKKCCLH
jgi:uncharacterized protein